MKKVFAIGLAIMVLLLLLSPGMGGISLASPTESPTVMDNPTPAATTEPPTQPPSEESTAPSESEAPSETAGSYIDFGCGGGEPTEEMTRGEDHYKERHAVKEYSVGAGGIIGTCQFLEPYTIKSYKLEGTFRYDEYDN